MPFERLDAWRLAHEFAVEVYRVTKAFPKAELYGLTSQIRRASFSIPANIAEGASKQGSHEFRRFLDIALGSFAELTYALRFARDVELLPVADFDRLETMRVRLGKLLWGLYAATAKHSRRGLRAKLA